MTWRGPTTAPDRPGDLFATTRWTQVLAAQGNSAEAGTALADLCAGYYAPVHAYIEHTARDLGDPRDLAHEFFAGLLGGSMLAGAEREKGRFRAYLLGAVKHFLADTRDRRHAAKRGAQFEHVPINAGPGAAPALDVRAPGAWPPDAWFDRQWGLAVLDRAVTALAVEHEALGKSAQFQVLKVWLTGTGGGLTQADAARQLGLTEGTVKVAVFRLRKRFRELVKAEIAKTVSTEEEAREELRYLIEVVR
jgi:DNA-directed RNA polymerase specialized sigma24 family protein